MQQKWPLHGTNQNVVGGIRREVATLTIKYGPLGGCRYRHAGYVLFLEREDTGPRVPKRRASRLLRVVGEVRRTEQARETPVLP